MISVEKFESNLDRDISWRKKEFSNLELLIQEKEENKSLLETLYRSAILLLYSHWEGHIKYCARYYIKYISSQDHKCFELKENFQQIMLGKHLSEKQIDPLNGKYIYHQQVLFNFFRGNMQNIFKVNEDETITTKSNLNFENLSIILSQLGLELGDLETKKAFIDEKLLDGRNSIAHGSKRGREDLQSLYEDIKKELLEMIEYFHSLISESIINQTYLKQPVESS